SIHFGIVNGENDEETLSLSSYRSRKRMNMSAVLYAENDEQARARAQAWWAEMCRNEPYLLDEYVAPKVERKTHYMRSGVAPTLLASTICYYTETLPNLWSSQCINNPQNVQPT